jgi:hypothetical protein
MNRVEKMKVLDALADNILYLANKSGLTLNKRVSRDFIFIKTEIIGYKGKYETELRLGKEHLDTKSNDILLEFINNIKKFSDDSVQSHAKAVQFFTKASQDIDNIINNYSNLSGKNYD